MRRLICATLASLVLVVSTAPTGQAAGDPTVTHSGSVWGSCTVTVTTETETTSWGVWLLVFHYKKTKVKTSVESQISCSGGYSVTFTGSGGIGPRVAKAKADGEDADREGSCAYNGPFGQCSFTLSGSWKGDEVLRDREVEPDPVHGKRFRVCQKIWKTNEGALDAVLGGYAYGGEVCNWIPYTVQEHQADKTIRAIKTLIDQ